MRILHICMVQYSDGWTYQENLLAKYHKRLGNDVTVLTSMLCYQEGKLVEDTKTQFTDVNGVSVIRLKKSKSGFMGKFPEYIGFYEILEKLSPDIIFSHGCQYKDVVFTAEYVKDNPNVRLFVDNHADFTNSATNFLSKNFLHKIVWRYYAHRLLPYTEKFWGVLPARVDFLVNVYKLPKEKCELLVMGVDDELVETVKANRSRELIRAKYYIQPDDFLIMTGGKINHNRPETLNLMKAVCDSSIDHIKLIIFGVVSDELKNQFDELLRNNDRIQFVGWLDSKLTYEFMDAADLIVFPGLHSVMWEQAVGMGIPCIFKKIPGFTHVDLGGNAIFMDDTSSDGLKKAIENIVSNPGKYQKMRSVAIEQGMKVFSYRDIAERCIEIS